MKTRLAGPGLNLKPGQETGLPTLLAQMLIDGGFAEALSQVEATPGVETAEKRPAERAVSRRGRKKTNER